MILTAQLVYLERQFVKKIQSKNPGCLPSFWHGIPWLFPDFFLVFTDSPSTSSNFFSWNFSSQNQKFLKFVKILMLFIRFAVLKIDFLILLKFPDFFEL